MVGCEDQNEDVIKAAKAERSKAQQARTKDMRKMREDTANEECPVSQCVEEHRNQVMTWKRERAEEQEEYKEHTIQEIQEAVCGIEG